MKAVSGTLSGGYVLIQEIIIDVVSDCHEEAEGEESIDCEVARVGWCASEPRD